MRDPLRWLARLRVPLGFVAGPLVLWLARPTWPLLAAGSVVAAIGECIRVWAAGHLEKSREITRSGPYRWTRQEPSMARSLCVNIFSLFFVPLLFVSHIAEAKDAVGQPLPKQLAEEFKSGDGAPTVVVYIDLNNDGRLDWVLFPDLISDWCGSQGCNYPAYVNLRDAYCEPYAVHQSELHVETVIDSIFSGDPRHCISKPIPNDQNIMPNKRVEPTR